MFRLYLLIATFMFAPTLWAEPVVDDIALPLDADPKRVRAGQFIWQGDAVSSGEIVGFVSIPEQRLYLYRNGVLIALSSVSTGKRGYGTPSGLFSVLEKDRHHRSRTYDNAPMPYANRLTWQGVALHAGHVPSYPASHGCIRLPAQFARLLFGVSKLGMTVVVVGYPNSTLTFGHPDALPPFDNLAETDLLPEQDFRWQPENATEGPISLVLSEANQYLLVYRHGVEIGRAKISMTLSEKGLGTRAFLMQANENMNSDSLLTHRWMVIGSGQSQDNRQLDSSFFEHLDIPAEFVKSVNSLLTANTTLVVTNQPIVRQSTLRTASSSQVRCVRGNCLHGLGTQVYANGSKYVGQFRNGVSEGQGLLILANGEKYTGLFKNDRFQGDN